MRHIKNFYKKAFDFTGTVSTEGFWRPVGFTVFLLLLILIAMALTGNRGVGDPESIPLLIVYWVFLFMHFFLLLSLTIRRLRTKRQSVVDENVSYRSSNSLAVEAPLVDKTERLNLEKSIELSLKKGGDKSQKTGCLEFYRTDIEDGSDLSNLTLSNTFFGRSEVGAVSFYNTKLSDSNLCWNDFVRTDFTECDLSGSDLRASNFTGVKFVNSNLEKCDLRHSNFKDCLFEGANFKNAKLTHEQKIQFSLSDEQIRSINWLDDEGLEPDGG